MSSPAARSVVVATHGLGGGPQWACPLWRDVVGDGEVDGTAIETSLKPTLQFIVHKGKGKGMVAPRAENATHWIVTGLDRDLNLALKNAVQAAVDFLMQEKGLDAGAAYALASIAVDFRVAEAVNLVQGVYGMIPKNIFKEQKNEYWFKQ